MNIYCDKYFTKSKEVAKHEKMNPIVKYRVFGRFDGITALNPIKKLIKILCSTAKVNALPEGTKFESGDTIITIEDNFQNIVEFETMYLQWIALPCYCAYQAKLIVDIAKDKDVMDFHARHLYGAESVALASYGASIGGIKSFSTDVGANPLEYLDLIALNYVSYKNIPWDIMFKNRGIGTTPHALIAIFNGDYIKMAKSYLNTYPDDKFIALIDYNNKEVDDTVALYKEFGDKLYGVRIDTCGENMSQGTADKGVSKPAIRLLRASLDSVGGSKVKIFVSSGFNVDKTNNFIDYVSNCFDGIGTGSFIPKGPTVTSDIMWVDGKKECKVGREWGYDKDEKFYSIISDNLKIG